MNTMTSSEASSGFKNEPPASVSNPVKMFSELKTTVSKESGVVDTASMSTFSLLHSGENCSSEGTIVQPVSIEDTPVSDLELSGQHSWKRVEVKRRHRAKKN